MGSKTRKWPISVAAATDMAPLMAPLPSTEQGTQSHLQLISMAVAPAVLLLVILHSLIPSSSCR